MLECESRISRGWIAFTSDAVFFEKPQHYNLVVDLTSYTPKCRATPHPSPQLVVKVPHSSMCLQTRLLPLSHGIIMHSEVLHP